MRVHDFVNEGLGHSSYLIDLGDGTAAVVDPPRFPTAHEQAARRSGLRVAWTLDTHSHADYVTGSPRWPPARTRCSSPLPRRGRP
jgi:hydroxyacylglutathione hydrolase